MKKKYLFGYLLSIFIIFGCSNDDEMVPEVAENISLVSMTIENQNIVFDDVRVILLESSTSNFPYRIVAKNSGSPSDTSFIFSLLDLPSGTIILNGELRYEDKLFITLGNDLIIPDITVSDRNKLEGTFEGNVFGNGSLDESLILLNGKFDLFLN